MNNQDFGIRVSSVLVLLMGWGSAASAQVVFNPENNHAYEFVSASVTWHQARTAAEAKTLNGISGHLVTIGSAAEFDFLHEELLSPEGASKRPWIGITDELVEGEWLSVDGTPVWFGDANGSVAPGAFAKWIPGQPDDDFGAEDYAYMPSELGWNDQPNSTPNPNGYVVEYDRFVVEDPFTGHRYEYVPGGLSWTQANQAANAMTVDGLAGHLVAFETEAEHQYVQQNLLSKLKEDANPWIGATDSVVEDEWRWVTGTIVWNGKADGMPAPCMFADWLSDQPDNDSEDYAYMPNNGKWNDQPNSTPNPKGFLVEYQPFLPTCTVFNGSGVNPLDLGCLNIPTLGTCLHASVELAPSVGTTTLVTGIALAFGGAVVVPIAGSGELLVLGPYVLDFATGEHVIPLPLDPSLSGLGLHAQGLRLELVGSGIRTVLLNGLELTLGT